MDAATLIGKLEQAKWAALSAEQHTLTAADNAARTADLAGDLQQSGVDYVAVTGHYTHQDGTVTTENSFILVGEVAPAVAEYLGRVYGQESVLVPGGRLYCETGELDAFPGTWSVLPEGAPLPEYYSVLDGRVLVYA